MTARVEFCGESVPVGPGQSLVMGREGDLVIDENPYLHRRFLQLFHVNELWWLANLGTQLSATLADVHGTLQAWLSPGARVPLVIERTVVWFTAGPTTYELEIVVETPPFVPVQREVVDHGATTVGPTSLTPEQRLLIVALAEPILRRRDHGASRIPSNEAAARRLGWTATKFNRKLDNVCEKLTRSGVRGLHGGPGRLAVTRRARLVEWALAGRLVVPADLALLDRAEDTCPESAPSARTTM